MSVLTPHIKVLRAEGAALIRESREQHSEVDGAENAEEKTVFMVVALTLARLGKVKLLAADQLEAEKQEMIARFRTGEKSL